MRVGPSARPRFPSVYAHARRLLATIAPMAHVAGQSISVLKQAIALLVLSEFCVVDGLAYSSPPQSKAMYPSKHINTIPQTTYILNPHSKTYATLPSASRLTTTVPFPLLASTLPPLLKS